MNIKITPSKLSGKVSAVSSKSYAHRAIIAAAFSDKPTDIYLNCFSEDIEATLRCIKAIGAEAEFSKAEGRIRIIPAKKFPESCLLDAGESGSTARFMLPVAAAVCNEVLITGRGRLPERPMTPLIRELRKKGVKIDSEKLPLKTDGRLRGGEYEIEGNISSQYITGLLFALSLMEDKSVIKLLSPLESKGYIDITVDVLKSFGAEISFSDNAFYVTPVGFKSSGSYRVEGDWSNSAFFLVADKIGHNIETFGLNYESRQGDRKITDIIEMFKDGRGDFSIDASDIPDLVPIISTLALYNIGETKIYNAERLRLKESDRIKTTVEALKALGGELKETNDGIIIKGKGTLRGGTAEGFNDHRIIMALAVAASAAEGESVILGAEGVKKSYPNFFEDFIKLGGVADVI